MKEGRAMAALPEATDATFEQEVLKSEIPVLVDFWAPGCPPCAALSPILEKVAAEMVGKVKFMKMNAAQERSTANKYRVQAVPTLFLFKGGEIAESVIGFKPEPEIRRLVTAALGE